MGLVRIQPLDELRGRFAHLDAAPRALRVGAAVKINLAAEQHGLVAQETDVRGREKGVHLGAALLFPSLRKVKPAKIGSSMSWLP